MKRAMLVFRNLSRCPEVRALPPAWRSQPPSPGGQLVLPVQEGAAGQRQAELVTRLQQAFERLALVKEYRWAPWPGPRRPIRWAREVRV